MTTSNQSVVGIDYSMTSPAMTIIHNDRVMILGTSKVKKHLGHFEEKSKSGIPFYFEVFPYPTYECEQERYGKLADLFIPVIGEILKDAPHLIVQMEGYSMGSKGKVFHIAENTEVLKWRLWREMGINIEVPSPNEVKKSATGKGNADKFQMYDAFVKETGINLSERFGVKEDRGPVSDLVDSYHVARWTPF